MSDNMLQSSDDFKVLFIQSWCFKHPSLPPPPPPPKKNIPAKHYVLSKRYLLKANGWNFFFKNGPSICIVNVWFLAIFINFELIEEEG